LHIPRRYAKGSVSISNALDGSKDVVVWEDDVDDKDDSDWVESTDNDSVMSDDGESDE
jgi:hypothetical protein